MRKNWGLFLVLFLSLGAVRPLLSAGYFEFHDNTQVVRVFEMAQAMGDGQFPVRWLGDLGYGYGYPLFNFYAPLAYYVGGFFNLVGLDALVSTKLMMILGVIFSGVTMYFLARELWAKVGGIVAALFYVYSPYHAVDIYVRGAVGEYWAMAFLPLLFLAIVKVAKLQGGKVSKWIVVGVFSLAAIVLSHNLTAMMAVPFVIGLILVLTFLTKQKKLLIVHYSLLIIFGLGLSAFYWLPALREMGLTKVMGQIGGGADWRDHFVFIDQLWASPWGFGGSAPGRLDGMSFMIGKLHLVLTVFSLLIGFIIWLIGLKLLSSLCDRTVLVTKLKKRLGWGKGWKKSLGVAGWGMVAGLAVLGLAVFLTNRVSAPVWEWVSPMAFFQYPWRFLVMATLGVSFLTGSVMVWIKSRKISLMAASLLIFSLLVFNFKYFSPKHLKAASLADYTSEENVKWQVSKISDEYLPFDFPAPQNEREVAWEKVKVLTSETEIKILSQKAHRLDFEVSSQQEAVIIINTAYFPGWNFELDGKKAGFEVIEGKIRLKIPSGEHRVELNFGNTPVRNLANLVSLFSLLALGLSFFKKTGGHSL